MNKIIYHAIHDSVRNDSKGLDEEGFSALASFMIDMFIRQYRAPENDFPSNNLFRNLRLVSKDFKAETEKIVREMDFTPYYSEAMQSLRLLHMFSYAQKNRT